MQQGLAFNPSLVLLKVFGIFNGCVFHVRIIFYAPHHTHTSKQWNKIKNNHQIVLTEQNNGIKLFYTSIRSRGYKNAKNGAKMCIILLKQGTWAYLQENKTYSCLTARIEALNIFIYKNSRVAVQKHRAWASDAKNQGV
jgi:hypothetical protein